MRTNAAGLALIREFEGCVLHAYPDPATGGDPWTIGYGHTGGVHPGMTISQAQADALLLGDVAKFEMLVLHAVRVPLTDNQLSALVSFAYNVKSWQTSTLIRDLNASRFSEAANEFPKWCHANGKVMLGLVRRRDAERALFLAP